MRQPIHERLAKYIAVTNDPSECWLWTASRDTKGYGRLGIAGFPHTATRLLWTAIYGPIPDGLWVLHRCDNPPCCNLAHLFLGTPTDNSHDAATKGRLPHGEQVRNAKLTDKAVREIRSSADTAKELAARFGVSPRRIRRVRQGNVWRHVK